MVCGQGCFISSRRRHTRYIGDWSSDVCSSDLAERLEGGGFKRAGFRYGYRGDSMNANERLQSDQTSLDVDRYRLTPFERSEERRVGKECRCRRRPDTQMKKQAGGTEA